MKIAITGCGWVTPAVAGRIEHVLLAYTQRQHPSTLSFEPISQSIFDAHPNLPSEAAKEGPVRAAAIALEIACSQSNFRVNSDRKGLIVGNALAGLNGMIDFAQDVREQSPRFVSPIRFPQTVGNYICGALARCYDFRGPASTVACGAASSLEAIREAASFLASGQADMMVAGGCETLSTQIVEAFNLPNVRFADGACFFVLEREADASRRGIAVLGVIDHPALPAVHDASIGDSNYAAGYRPRGAFCVEDLTGRTLGADGAASLAAAIGNLSGQLALQDPAPERPSGNAVIRAKSMFDEVIELTVKVPHAASVASSPFSRPILP